MKTILRNERGLTLAIVLMMMVVLISITGAGLLFSSLNLKASANLKGGTAAMQAADAGIQHALAAIPVGGDFDSLLTGGVSGFPCYPASPCNGSSNKPTLTGSINGYSYTAVVENDTTVVNETATNDINTTVILTSTATGPNGSNRKVRAYIGRFPWIPPGAIYLPGNPNYIETRFNGNSFGISGRDSNPGQADGSGSASPIAGIATTYSGTTTEIVGGSLTSTQYGQVTGQGSNPSVSTSSTILDVYQLAQNLIALGVEGVDKQTLDHGNYSSGIWGTTLLPKITHITGDATMTGSLTGWGVLIIDGDMKLRGGFTFNGLVICLGDADINGSNGGGDVAKVWGTLLIKESTSSDSSDELRVAGGGSVDYSSLTLKTVTDKWPNAFSTKARIIAWNEMM